MTTFNLFASDLDGTLIPGPGRNPDSAGSEAFRSWRERYPGLHLAYLTGRHRASALKALERFGLPIPDFLACDVGTTIHQPGETGWVEDTSYADWIRRGNPDWRAAGVREALTRIPELEAQPDEHQSEFKISFVLEPEADFEEIRLRVTARLTELGFYSSLILSRALESGSGLLDVLPQGCSKKSALEHLCRKLTTAPDRVIVAGDSGNDVDVLTGDFRAILVGNAAEEVRSEVRRRARPETVFFARRPTTYGALEGLAHFGLT